MSDTIFGKIIEGKISADIVYEDDRALAFHDVNPVAPVHVLVVPKKPIPRLIDAEEADGALLGHLMDVAKKVAKKLGVEEHFRVVINNGVDAGQTVFHLHLHVIAGRPLSWPPG